jgi:hypothetical protein
MQPIARPIARRVGSPFAVPGDNPTKPRPAVAREILPFQVLPGPFRPVSGRRNVEAVESRDEIRDFLTSRRVKITPDQAGLPPTAATGA